MAGVLPRNLLPVAEVLAFTCKSSSQILPSLDCEASSQTCLGHEMMPVFHALLDKMARQDTSTQPAELVSEASSEKSLVSWELSLSLLLW